MFFVYHVLPWLLTAALFAFFYQFLRRWVDRLWKVKNQAHMRWGVIVVSLLLALFALHLTSLWTLFLLMFVGFVLLGEGVFWLFFRRNKAVYLRLCICALLPFAVTAALFVYGVGNAQRVHATHYEKEVKLSRDYRILFISDLHYPTTMGEDGLQTLCEQLSDQQADLLILGGDIVDEHTSEEEMRQVFAHLGSVEVNKGIYAVYGNHDAGYSGDESGRKELLEEMMAESGITLLCDESVSIDEELVLIGRDDAKHPRNTARASSEQLLAQAPAGVRILIDHQPLSLNENAALGVSVQLSGHTHNGQVFPIGVISALLSINEQTYGRSDQGAFTAIVSSGAGGWGYAFRNEGICEYVILDLHAQREKGSAEAEDI